MCQLEYRGQADPAYGAGNKEADQCREPATGFGLTTPVEVVVDFISYFFFLPKIFAVVSFEMESFSFW